MRILFTRLTPVVWDEEMPDIVRDARDSSPTAVSVLSSEESMLAEQTQLAELEKYNTAVGKLQ